MYERHPGDDLLSKDKRLKYKWKWKRSATNVDEDEIKRWTHFQCSYCNIPNTGFSLKVTQWGDGSDSGTYYQYAICYWDNHIYSSDMNTIKTRLDAQIKAEKELKKWITTQYKIITGVN